MDTVNDCDVPPTARHIEVVFLNLSEVRQHRIYHLKGLVDLFSDLSSSQDDLSRDEDEEHNLWLHHTVDKTGEELRFIGAEVVMARSQTFQTDGEFDIAGADNILDFEVRELGIKA